MKLPHETMAGVLVAGIIMTAVLFLTVWWVMNGAPL
jgi:hypothetical protein